MVEVEELGQSLLVQRHPGADRGAVYKDWKGSYKDDEVLLGSETSRSNSYKVSREGLRWDGRKILSLGEWCSLGMGHQKGGGISGHGGFQGSGRQSHG